MREGFSTIMGVVLWSMMRLAVWSQDAQPTAGTNIVFEETFTGDFDREWTWLRAAPQRWCIRHEALEIRVMPGLADTVENALVRPLNLDGRGESFALEVAVTFLQEPKQQYEQAGITWYVEGRPAFKLVKELVDGEIVVIPGRKPVSGDWIQLRLEVRGNKFLALFRTDRDAPFAEAARGELPRGAEEQISLQCYHGPPDAEHWIRFDDFRLLLLEDRP